MRSTVSTRQPPAGGPGGTSHPDALLRELRRGERDAFVRYFELFRSPVYGFTRRLLDDDAAAVAATTETFAVVFRRAVLDEGAADLQALTYRCALDACVVRAEAGGVPRRPASETNRRFEAALESLDLRRRAALLLHDVARPGRRRHRCRLRDHRGIRGSTAVPRPRGVPRGVRRRSGASRRPWLQAGRAGRGRRRRARPRRRPAAAPAPARRLLSAVPAGDAQVGRGAGRAGRGARARVAAGGPCGAAGLRRRHRGSSRPDLRAPAFSPRCARRRTSCGAGPSPTWWRSPASLSPPGWRSTGKA